MAVLFLNFSSQELNTQNETIVLADAQAAVSADDLNKHVPDDKGRYIFYLFKHTFEGDYMESISKGKFLSLTKPNVLRSLIAYFNSLTSFFHFRG